MSNSYEAEHRSLVAILLITQSSKDPSLVFHYPPQPGQSDLASKHLVKEQSIANKSAPIEDSSSSSEDDGIKAEQAMHRYRGGNPATAIYTTILSQEQASEPTMTGSPALWNDLFGYQSGHLAKLLCPPESWHDSRFELGADGRVFIGRPIAFSKYARKSDHLKPQDPGADSAHGEDSTVRMEENMDTDRGPAKRNTKGKSYHIVFVLEPPPLEYHAHTREIYDHVVRRLVKVLKMEEKRSGFVTAEHALISATTRDFKQKSGKDGSLTSLYHEISKRSTLARALGTLYQNLVASKIAYIALTPKASFTVQIPIVTSMSTLPLYLPPQISGLWLTTSTPTTINDTLTAPQTHPAAHFGLLLLADVASILADLGSTESPIALSLIRYLHMTKPTKSFIQVSRSSGISLADVQILASHLIYWRRARAIPPLNQRDVYIVSPVADMSRLVAASASFAQAFPTLPSLCSLLGLLSGTPRPYSSIIPSIDHKEVYLEILAWLMRDCWITQLRTFAWICVPSCLTNAYQHETRASTKSSTSNRADSIETPAESAPKSQAKDSFPITQSTPSALRSLHLSRLSRYVLEKNGIDMQSKWDSCVPFFDGRHALEGIAVSLGWKKKHTADTIARWERLGIISKVRHW